MKNILLFVLTCSILMWGCEASVQNQAGNGGTDMEIPSEMPNEPDKAKPAVENELPSPQKEEEEEMEYTIPTSKSKEILTTLDAMEKDAFAAEKAYFSTPRVVEWVEGLEDGEDMDGMPVYGKLEQNKFDQLNAKENLYYYLYHPESWDQLCAEVEFTAGRVEGIAKSMPYDMSGDESSTRQDNALKENQDSIRYWVSDYLDHADKVSVNLLRTVVTWKWVEMLPRLIEIYQNQDPKMDLILTSFIALMGRGGMEFKPWIDSDLNKSNPNPWFDILTLTEVNADKIIYYTKEFIKESQTNE